MEVSRVVYDSTLVLEPPAENVMSGIVQCSKVYVKEHTDTATDQVGVLDLSF